MNGISDVIKTGHSTEALVTEVLADFNARREIRRNIEAKWLLNINFLLGNQYSSISPNGDIADFGKQFFWQEREVYNHIAPIIESRLAKFTRVNSRVVVRPASASDNDVNVAKLATKLVDSASQDNDFIGLSALANYWSELTGTAFYKVMWNNKHGKMVAKSGDKTYFEGDIKISVCPPYEVYPDSLAAQSIEECSSIIHARAYTVAAIEDIWGVKVEGTDVSVINMDTTDGVGGLGYSGKSFRVFSENKNGHAIVIEKYCAPSKAYPSGRLIIIAGKNLLFDGELPYRNGKNGERAMPFVRQIALSQPASFYGISVIERLIPIQRAYNAVKNRKHEFINRLSCGVVAVEDGSIDVENLEDEGFAPGKIITYRQGSVPPQIISTGSIPSEFRDEEDRLLSEFVSISGISNLVNNTSIASSSVSGYALSLLLEQDYSRLSVTTESIRQAVKGIAHQILRLFRQFAKTERIIKVSGENGELEILSFLGSDLNSDDIVMEADSEMVETPAVRKKMVLELLANGLLSDENGKIGNRNKAKILEMMGFGNWESSRSFEELHIKKASIENSEMQLAKDCGIEEVDDHEIHIEEHSRYLISGRDDLSDNAKNVINKHIREHKILSNLILKAEIANTTQQQI